MTDLCVSISSALKKQIEAAAKKEHRSVSDWIQMKLVDEIERSTRTTDSSEQCGVRWFTASDSGVCRKKNGHKGACR